MAMVLFVIGMTALSSCTKSKENLILGKWKLESVSATYGGQTYEMSVSQLVDMYSAFGASDVENLYIEFKDDGKVYGEGGSASYTIDGDKLTIMDEGEVFVVTITELTSSALTLEETEVDDEVGEMTMSLHFKKA